MAYIEGFVAAVPAANKDAYIAHAKQALDLIREHGASRMVEAWGDDVPDGEVTDFRGAVQARDDEVIVFSWFEYPDRATRDAAHAKMMQDPRLRNMMSSMLFDGMRMIYGGFDAIVDAGAQRGATYIDGSLLPVPAATRDAYRDFAARQTALIMECGALRVVDAWGDDLKDGKITDFKRAVKAKSGETTVFSWIEWPSKEARDAAWPKLMADPRMAAADGLYDGQRRVFGGFRPVVDA